MSLPWVISDLDDTLIGAQVKGEPRAICDAYYDVIDRFGDAMAKLGFDKKATITMQDQIDRQMCRTHGFGDKTRFAQSMVATYEQMSTETAISPSDKFRQEMYDIGMTVFTDYPYVLHPNALEWLALAGKTHRLAIVTKGAVDEQTKKLKDVGLLDKVERAVVLERKSVEEWDRTVRYTLGISESDMARSWVVGDSVKSDINPALTVGLNAIHVYPPTSWGYEHEEYGAPLNNRHLLSYTHLSAVLEAVRTNNILNP